MLDSENCQFSTQRGQSTKRPRLRHTFTGVAVGGLSVSVCCVGMAVPLNRTGCSSPPLFLGGGNNFGNIATQPTIFLIMSQEIGEGMIPPRNPEPIEPGVGMCALSWCFIVLGLASIALGIYGATELSTDYSGYYARTNQTAVLLYLAGGMLTGLFNFALAVIVDACQKYRKRVTTSGEDIYR